MRMGVIYENKFYVQLLGYIYGDDLFFFYIYRDNGNGGLQVVYRNVS